MQEEVLALVMRRSLLEPLTLVAVQLLHGREMTAKNVS